MPSRSVQYFLTLTLTRHFSQSNMIAEQFDISTTLFNDFQFNDMKATCVAELTEAGVIHMHALVDFELPKKGNIIRDFQDMLRLKSYSKIFGFMKMDPANDYNKIVDYLSKDLKKTYDDLKRKRHPVIKDDFNIFNKTIWNVNWGVALPMLAKAAMPYSDDYRIKKIKQPKKNYIKYYENGCQDPDDIIDLSDNNA